LGLVVLLLLLLQKPLFLLALLKLLRLFVLRYALS
jgi:hypothetical protein